ncbi:hypothetical protein MLD38_019117 [Melastoma candidum]|uniref:Uncharacterized protein n=1 Tax=Melastoma candidum TaxID=119954 RepID=A0ACB9QX12_9MYRT|nr:hypothetical protein MLD38_019117 [Melastoma candidum]
MWFLGLPTTSGKSILITGAILLVILFTLILRKLAVYLDKDRNGKKGRCDKCLHEPSKGKATASSGDVVVIRTYPLEELRLATSDFKFRIGAGTCYCVYLAELGEGRFGAVKRLRVERGGNKKMFLDEVSALLRISHPNIIELLGFCCEGGEQLLLLEHVPSGNLFDRLHTPKGHSSGILTWSNRVKIALGIARALMYLHHQADPPVIHRYVKSSSILLINENHAKLADFGLCKTSSESYFSQTPCIIKGSVGHVDVNYLRTGMVSPKNDVYSYGVLLLELITGLKSMQRLATLPEWTEDTRKKIDDDKGLMELLDPKLNHEADIHQLKVLVDIANSALIDYPEERPDMKGIVNRIASCMEPVAPVDLPVHRK